MYKRSLFIFVKGFYESGGGRGGGGGGGSLVHPPHHQPQGTVYDVRYLVDGDVAYWYWGVATSHSVFQSNYQSRASTSLSVLNMVFLL